MDLRVSFGAFNCATVEVKPLTEKGIAFFEDRFGQGACSAILPKSEVFYLDLAVAYADLSVDWC